MKTLKNLLWSLLCLTFVVACSEDAVDDKGKEPNTPGVTMDSELKLKKGSISVSLSGGDYSIEYTLKNPHEGFKVEAEAAEPWVKDFKVNTQGSVIRFTVEPNDTDAPRSCVVTVSYRYAEPVAFTVKQNAKVDAGFSIANVRTTYFDYTVDVIPDDKNTPYIVMSAHPEYIVASEFENGEDFYEDDLGYFAWLGQFYGNSAVEIMQIRSKLGDTENVQVTDGASGVPYTFYCYYFDYESGALLSEVEMFTITTASPELQNVEFNFETELKDGVMLSADVTANGYDGHYYFDVLPKVIVDEYLYDLVTLEGNQILTTNEKVIEYWWSDAVADMMQDMSAEQIISAYTSLGQNSDGTPRSHYDFELLSEVDYYLFAFAMEEHGLCSSVPQIVPFKTGTVAPSDNVITPSFDKLTSRTAKFTFTPTNDDYYVAGWEKKSDWATYGNTTAEIQEYLLKNLEFELLKGEKTVEIIDLEPGTEYILYAFGSRGGVATTKEIFQVPFKTKDGGKGGVDISIKDLGYYFCPDFEEFEGYGYIAVGQPEYERDLVLPIELEFSSADHGDYFYEIYDWTTKHESEYYDEKQIMDGLVWSIREYGSITVTHTYTFLSAGGKYELVAVVLDSDGMFSSLYRRWLEPTYDGCGNASDFVSWWDAYQESQSGDLEGGDDSGTGLQSLVVDHSQTKLFSKKVKANKVSTTIFETKEVVPAHDEVVVRK